MELRYFELLVIWYIMTNKVCNRLLGWSIASLSEYNAMHVELDLRVDE